MSGRLTHVMGDSNTGGGRVNSIPQSTTFLNGRLVCVDGSRGTGHKKDPPHNPPSWRTDNGSAGIIVEGKRVNKQGDTDTCGHARATSTNNGSVFQA